MVKNDLIWIFRERERDKCVGMFVCVSMLGRDVPRGPVIKTLPSDAGSAGSIPGRGTKILHAS